MKNLLICLFALLSIIVLIVGPVNAIVDPTDFMNNTEKYRGKQITVTGHISSVIFASDNESLRDYKGKVFELYVYATGDHIKIFIPENLTDVPKAVFPDRVVVTFICKDGDPKHGNVAVSIKLSP